MFVYKESGKIVTRQELCDKHNMSIPEAPDQETLKALGVQVLVETQKPSPYHTVQVIEKNDGLWREVWKLPAVEIMAREKNRELNIRFAEKMSSIKGQYPHDEIFSWDKQEAEARNGGGSFTRALAEARGLDHEELLKRIIAKADAFAAFSATLIGVRQRLVDEISAASTAEEILAIEWPEDA
ncbi:hypothetical protein [Pseudomonas sp. zfem003]|uniref:hypothetical protein n=1 Tax=Pseudomonas sp. zfem003 TaxID=3078198 RepID=UPI00292979A4|nr:hypothetical protein [Pseudomonas sp. zfem003]MDU9398019.1 hypothetical protein [Pseudomonas sp. zfem003]